jgi:hypothetical protein
LQGGVKKGKLIMLSLILLSMTDELIRKLKQLEIIYKEPVNLKNAGASSFYVDVKKAYGYSDVLNLISDELWK